MPSNSPSRSTENDSPAPAKWKETDDDTLVDYNQIYSNLLENKQDPSRKHASKAKSINEKRMSKQEGDQSQNLEVLSKKQRTSVAQYKEVTQAVEKPSKKANKDSNKTKEKSEAIKEPLNKRNPDTNLPGEKAEGLGASLQDDEIKAKIKQCRKIRVGYSEACKQLNFTLDYLNQTDKTMKTIELTRNQMLIYNPKLVLMFYEKNLQFPQMPDFNIHALKQV